MMLLPNGDDHYVELNDTASVIMTMEDCKNCRINSYLLQLKFVPKNIKKYKNLKRVVFCHILEFENFTTEIRKI